MASSSLPETHKALVQEVYAEPLIVKTLPTPQPIPGSAIIRVLHAPIISYMKNVYNGQRKYKYPTPLIPGTSAIGRIAAKGPDAVLIKEGDLVLFDSTIRGRDDHAAIFLSGLSEGGTDGSRKLMQGEWRDSSFAEYAKVPLENVFVLDEARLCGSPKNGGLGYQPGQLAWLLQALVPYGGLRSVNLQAGEMVVVAPATGGFGSAAVVVALAMGARVIAMGRNTEALEKTKALGAPGRVETVQITNDLQTELAALSKFGKADVYFDISPSEAEGATYFKAAILSLRHAGRVSYMGGFLEDTPIPIRFIMRFDITLKGKWMYSRQDNLDMVKLVTGGLLDFRNIAKVLGTYKLEQWEEAFEASWNGGRLGDLVLFEP